MVRNRILMSAVLLVALTGGGMLVLSSIRCSAAPPDFAYKQVVPPRDTERRQQPLGNATEDSLLDVTAFVGMPESYSEAASKYVDAVLSTIKAEPIKRRHFYHPVPRNADDQELTTTYQLYPEAINPVYDRDTVVSLVLLPRPAAVGTWSASAKARSLGWRPENEVSQRRGSVYGRTLIYQPGKLSKNPKSLPTTPIESELITDDLYLHYNEDYGTRFFLELGKLIDRPSYDYESPREALLDDRFAVLRLGEKEGAKLLGELITIPAYLKNPRLRWVSIQNGSDVRRFVAYSLLDGNGARRWHPSEIYKRPASEKISPYVRPLRCERHQPKIQQHDELLLPTPLAWAPTIRESIREQKTNEEWCLDDWFPAQKDACWVIREAGDSKPLQESFLMMSASEPSDRPVFFIALFAETEPKQLVQELATLHKVSPAAALESSETMERLNALYEKLRDFPLAE